MLRSSRAVGLSAVLAGVVAGLLLGALLYGDDNSRLSGGTAATLSTATPASVEPTRLTAPVTSIATRPGSADPLSMVRRAETIVLAARGDAELLAAQLALRLRAPLLLAATPSGSEAGSNRVAAPDDPTAELTATFERLGVVRAIVVGPAALERNARLGGARDVVRLPEGPQQRGHRQIIRAAAAAASGAWVADMDGEPPAVEELLAGRPPAPRPTRTAVLVRPDDDSAVPLVLAARAVGHTVIPTRVNDLRADPAVIKRLAELRGRGRPPQVVLGGRAMAAVEPGIVAAHLATVATGRQLPGGGQLVIDPRRPHARRYVGLYGVTQSPVLGALGEQPVNRSVARAKQLARRYRRVTDDVDVIGCFEIIATVASSSAGRDGNYARERPIADLAPAVAAARRAGIYVLLDIQPGRSDFLTLAKRYRRLLRQPHVGLALDPEWRLRPNQRHLQQIGSVGIDEVNEVAGWLADLVQHERLPQKMLLIHQFSHSMVRGRERMDTSRDELAYVIQMDGQGPQGAKLETWRAITAARPDGVQFGWKNFYDEDPVVRTPADTMGLTPPPVFVSYQ